MQKKTIVVAFVISFFIASALTGMQVVQAGSKIITVPDDYSSIQVAIDNSDGGDTIYVRKGVYVENLVVNKSISLIGEDRDITEVDVTTGLRIRSENVTVCGFSFKGKGGNGILSGTGISLETSYCNILGNRIKDVTHGLVMFQCNGSYIADNIFESIGLSSAIQLNFANKNLIKNNLIDTCVEGIQIWQNSNNNTVTENTITNCQDTAINFQYSNDNAILGNNITRSGLGTSIYGSNRNTVFNNSYVYNAVQFGASESYYLTFGYNRSINAVYGNFWSDYNGTDLNGDGIGDSPYIIDSNNKDNYPYMEPASNLSPSIPNPSPIILPTFSPTPTSSLSPSLSSSLSPSLTPLSSPAQQPTSIQTEEPFSKQLVITVVIVVVITTILLVVLIIVSLLRYIVKSKKAKR